MDLTLAGWGDIIEELEGRYDCVVVAVCTKTTRGEKVSRRHAWRGNCYTVHGVVSTVLRDVEEFIDDPNTDVEPEEEMS